MKKDIEPKLSHVWIVEYREDTPSKITNNTVWAVFSSEKKARDYCKKEAKSLVHRKPTWWFWVSQNPIDMDFETYNLRNIVIDWHGNEIDYQPVGGYEK